MNAGRAVYGILSANSGVTDIVGTRIFPEIAEQEAVTPFVIYQLQRVAPEDTHDGPSKLDEVRFEFLCYADSYNEAADLGVAVRGALDRVSGTYNGVNVESVQFNDVDVEIEYDPRRYSQVLKFTFRIKRDDIEIALGTPVTGAELGDLSDVDVTGVTNGQLIAYNSTTGNWEAADDAGGASTLIELDDVQITNPFEGQSIRWDDGLQRWVKDGRTTALFDEFKKGLETTINNGEGTESELKLEQTKATVQTGKTKVVLTETSPGDIEFVVATDADGDTAFTALHLDGSSTANVADLIVKFGTYFKFEYGNLTQWIRPNSGATQDTTIILPSTSGVLGLANDIPTSVTDLTDVTSAGSGAIITDAERTNLTTNTAKVGLIAGGTTGQALVKSTGTDYDVEWADIAVDVQYHQRYDTEAAALRSGATETVELYYTAQADGDGLSESASSDTPTSGYDIRRKLYYAEKAQADPDTSADWTQFTAIADNTTFANAKAALLAYLKERTGGTVPISLKMTWEEVAQAPAFTGLLNESYGSGAEAAYSTRRLNGNVTECMVIRRASDSETETIGFDSEGNIDESAIETFCTGTTCTVVTWKDQSGNGNDVTAAAPTNEPTIYTGGALVKENGKVAINFDGSNDGLKSSNEIMTGAAICLIGVVNSVSSGNESTRYLDQTGVNGAALRGRALDGIYKLDSFCSIGNSLEFLSPAIDYAGSQIIHTANWVSGGSAMHVNGTEAATNSNTFSGGGNTGVDMGIGYEASGNRQYHEGTLQEILIYNSDKSTDRTSIESNIGDYFTQNTPLLDTYSGAAAAYSLRLLDSTYTGALVNVWNGTSYADIYPNVFGELDTVALAAHCGSNDGFIRYWYDQSGNSRTAAQTTTANMPKIYDGATGLVTENGKPAVEFDGSNDYINTSAFASDLTQPNFFSFVVKPISTGGTERIFSNANVGDRNFLLYDGRFYAGSFLSGGTIGTNQINMSILANGASSEIFKNSSSAASGNAGTDGVGSIRFAASKDETNHSNLKLQEFILWNSNESSNRTNIEDNINTFYNIY